MSQVDAISKTQIKSKGDPLETKKIEKKSHSGEKTERRYPLVSSGFVGWV